MQAATSLVHVGVELLSRLARAACDAPAASEELGEVERMTVLKATPACHLDYCSGVFQVMGVKLFVRPPPGVTLEEFARTLRCHNLRVLDGEVDASRVPNDPYGLRDSWLDIDVKPAGGNFVVTLKFCL